MYNEEFIFILAALTCSLNIFAQSTFFRIFSDVDAENLSGQHIVKTPDGNYAFLCANNYLPVIIELMEMEMSSIGFQFRNTD